MRVRNALAGLALALALSLLAGCRHGSDETQVRAAIASAQRGAEQADAGPVVAPLSAEFDGDGGKLQRQDLANLIRLARLRGEHVGVTLGPISVERRGVRLVADFTVTLTQGSGLLPDAAGVYQVQTAWRREGDQWRRYSATWTQPK